MNENLRVFVLGPLPPPYGGVSIHIVRFLELLEREGYEATGIPYTGIEARGALAKFMRVMAMVFGIYRKVWPWNHDVIHVHYGGLAYFVALIPLLWTVRSRKVVTFHSVRVCQDLENRPAWLRKLVVGSLNRFELLVCVRDGIADEVRRIGMTRPKITIMPAFLPPSDAEFDLARLPVPVVEVLESSLGEGRTQICCAAYYLGTGYGKADLYGVEELVAALPLIDSASQWMLDLWILVSNPPESDEAKNVRDTIMKSSSSLENIRVHLHFGLPMIPILGRSKVYVRPSREDGDSVAIREALCLGVEVLASDVVNRPEGVRTFSMDGPGNLAAALQNSLSGITTSERGQRGMQGDKDSVRFRDFARMVAGQSEPR